LAAVRSLEDGGVRTLLTAVYNHVQVVPAIIAGATYLAPYLGRMNDAGLDGVQEIAQMQKIGARAEAEDDHRRCERIRSYNRLRAVR